MRNIDRDAICGEQGGEQGEGEKEKDNRGIERSRGRGENVGAVPSEDLTPSTCVLRVSTYATRIHVHVSREFRPHVDLKRRVPLNDYASTQTYIREVIVRRNVKIKKTGREREREDRENKRGRERELLTAASESAVHN